MKFLRDMDIQQLAVRGWGYGSAGDLAVYEIRAIYHRKKAAESVLPLRLYHNAAAGINEFLNSLSF